MLIQLCVLFVGDTFWTFCRVLRRNVDESGFRRRERGFGTIWFFCHFGFCISAFLGFAIGLIFLSRRSPWSLAWTSVHRLSKVLHSHCKKRPNGLCSSSSRDASITYSWSENPITQVNVYPINNNTKINHGKNQGGLLSENGCAWLDANKARLCDATEAGRRERDHWAGSHQTYRDTGASL